MKVEYIVQPDVYLGKILAGLWESDPRPNRVVLISAFAGLQTVVRIKEQMANLHENGAVTRFVLGIDLGGTSIEVLRELLTWGIDVRIVKHRIPGHTFHPKIYLMEWDDRAQIIIGSSNVTEGGFFKNYEASVSVTYALPADLEHYEMARHDLSRFLDPTSPVAYRLTQALLDELVRREEIHSENELRENRSARTRESVRRDQRTGRQLAPIFGTEEIESPPPLPPGLLRQLIRGVRHRRRGTRSMTRASGQLEELAPINVEVKDVIDTSAFYMTLPKLQGANIPGEARIPLEAIELAPTFWGWPDEYTRDESPRAGRSRIYWNWRPYWQVWSTDDPNNISILQVRMYMYTNSSDFRFYARPLVNAGADLGDIVRIRHIAQPNGEFECILARIGTSEYKKWIAYCTQPVRNSTRRFGYV